MASLSDPRDNARDAAKGRETKPKQTERKAEADQPASKPAPVITDWAAI